MNEIRISLDEKGLKPINIIQWDNQVLMDMVDGRSINLNVAEPNSIAKATFYIINDTPNRFGIKEVKFPDSRIKVSLSSSWVIKDMPVKVTLTYNVPRNPTKEDIIKPADIVINGFFVIEG